MIAAIAFYLFSAVLIASAVMVIAARNPVHAVLFLILAFVNAAALFLLMGAEFLALMLVVVYVGAVAVLFLFVVMMLDIDFTELRQGFLSYAPVGALVGIVLLAELSLVLGVWAFAPEAPQVLAKPEAATGTLTNTEQIGLILYTDYIHLFQASGIILLVAMVGAIVLTLRERSGVRRQSIARQVARTPRDAVEVRKVKPGQGI